MPSINFSDVPSLEPLEPGAYNVEITHAEVATSKAGFPKIDLRWKVTEGDSKGRLIFDSLPFHPNALFRTKAALKALGWSDKFAGEVNPQDLIGLTAQVVVSIDDSNQTDPATGDPYPPRNRVVKVRPPQLNAESLLKKL